MIDAALPKPRLSSEIEELNQEVPLAETLPKRTGPVQGEAMKCFCRIRPGGDIKNGKASLFIKKFSKLQKTLKKESFQLKWIRMFSRNAEEFLLILFQKFLMKIHLKSRSSSQLAIFLLKIYSKTKKED